MTARIRALRTAAALLACSVLGAAAQGPLHTNESDIEEVSRTGTLDVKDPDAVFAFVLRSLPDRVKVLPTENYYYFRFAQNGVIYTGNIRLAAADRDQGRLHFAYGEEPSDWRSDTAVHRTMLDAARGVTVEKLESLSYRVSRGDRSVIFALNDLSQVKPPDRLLAADEKFLGLVFDESAVRFFLVFNTRLKIFHYILDESAKVPDEFAATKVSDRIQIGKRTGFAFYREETRKVLIGVNARSSRLNTALDGPFDQLPENFIEGEALRDAIIAASPAAKGKIDRLGNFADGSDRYLIHPYMLYRRESDLAVFHRCMTDKRVPPADRARCFVISDDEAQKPNPLPLALKR
jgi:hypothetical protein